MAASRPLPKFGYVGPWPAPKYICHLLTAAPHPRQGSCCHLGVQLSWGGKSVGYAASEPSKTTSARVRALKKDWFDVEAVGATSTKHPRFALSRFTLLQLATAFLLLTCWFLQEGTMLFGRLATLALLVTTSSAFVLPKTASTASSSLFSTTKENTNVAQTENTSRDKVMTFSYDMSLEPKYEKPTYPGTGNGLSGDAGEYDVIVIGSGMGGLACGALSAKYGDKVLVLESHIKCGGSAHTFSRMHKGEKYSFEVGPSIFEGLDRPSLNPLRMIFDILEEEMPVKTYTGLGYWTPTGYWRFPIGSQQKFEDLLMEQAEDGPKAVAVSGMGDNLSSQREMSSHRPLSLIGMERTPQTSQDSWWLNNCRFTAQSSSRPWISRHDCWKFAICFDPS